MLKISIPVTDGRIQAVPGHRPAKVFYSYVRAGDFPVELKNHLEVNPRKVKIRPKDGYVTSGVGPAIIDTLMEDPETMANRSLGVTILAKFFKLVTNPGGNKILEVTLEDSEIHGLVNGSHTYFSCLYAQKHSNGGLKKAYVPLTVKSGLTSEEAYDSADGLNTLQQVDATSLMNLDSQFELIKKNMTPEQIQEVRWTQGDEGNVPASHVCMMLEGMDSLRYTEDVHPTSLYRQRTKVLRNWEEDYNKKHMKEMVKDRLQDLLWLYAKLHDDIPKFYNENGGGYGKLHFSGTKGKYHIPFSPVTTTYKVPMGLVFPAFAAYRAVLAKKRKRVEIQGIYKKTVKRLVKKLTGELGTNKPGCDPGELGRNNDKFDLLYGLVDMAI